MCDAPMTKWVGGEKWIEVMARDQPKKQDFTVTFLEVDEPVHEERRNNQSGDRRSCPRSGRNR